MMQNPIDLDLMLVVAEQRRRDLTERAARTRMLAESPVARVTLRSAFGRSLIRLGRLLAPEGEAVLRGTLEPIRR